MVKENKILAVIFAEQFFDSRVVTKPRNVCTGGIALYYAIQR